MSDRCGTCGKTINSTKPNALLCGCVTPTSESVPVLSTPMTSEDEWLLRDALDHGDNWPKGVAFDLLPRLLAALDAERAIRDALSVLLDYEQAERATSAAHIKALERDIRAHVEAECACRNTGTHDFDCNLVTTEDTLRAALTSEAHRG